MQTLFLPTKVHFGHNALSALEQFQGKTVLVVTDKTLAQSGFLLSLYTQLQNSHIHLFDQVTPDPSLQLVAQGVQKIHETGAEVLLAFGGGSSIDCAKGMMFYASHEAAERPVLVCIPTTAGTGSEVSPFAVLTDTRENIKYPLVDEALFPQHAILEPSFLEKLPPKLLADTGFDTLTHAVEAMVAKEHSACSDALAERAFSMAYHALPAAHKGDMGAKSEMLLASTLAGMAFSLAGLGLCHALSHSLGGLLHLPHGWLNAQCLPQVIRFNAQEQMASLAYARLARACGLSGSARSLSSALLRLRGQLDCGKHAELSWGDLAPKLPELTAHALVDPCMAGNPRPVRESDVRQILKEVFA